MNGHDLDRTYNVAGLDCNFQSPLDCLVLPPRGDRAKPHVRDEATTAKLPRPLAERTEVDRFQRASPRPDGAESEPRGPAPAKRFVLLATGDDRLRAASQDYLKAQGYVVVTATGGVQCVGMLGAFIPDVVVLDAALLWGGANGVLACLRSKSRARIPVVFLALSADSPPQCNKAAAPIASVLKKPVMMASLLQAVKSAVGCGSTKGRGS